MIRQYCDICGHDLAEHSMNDLLGSRIFKVQVSDANNDARGMYILTLCNSCKGKMYYVVSNPTVLEKSIVDMKLINRIRYLFRKDIDAEVEG